MIHFAARETKTGAEVDAPINIHHDHMEDILNALGFPPMFLSEGIGLGGGLHRFIFTKRG